MRTVELREEHRDGNTFSLWVTQTANGGLRIEGQDLGPITSSVSDDGEYEYSYDVPGTRVAKLRELLGIEAGADLLDTIEEHWTAKRSWEFERIISTSGLAKVQVI